MTIGVTIVSAWLLERFLWLRSMRSDMLTLQCYREIH